MAWLYVGYQLMLIKANKVHSRARRPISYILKNRWIVAGAWTETAGQCTNWFDQQIDAYCNARYLIVVRKCSESG
jgi:hypothetical protein